jgi:predicted Zn-ribbon and HTH transcriptional regulator
MHLARPTTLSKRRPRRRQAGQQTAIAPARERNKRANLTQDAALYTCGCGYVFTAPVTTSVGCPHCGSAQAW